MSGVAAAGAPPNVSARAFCAAAPRALLRRSQWITRFKSKLLQQDGKFILKQPGWSSSCRQCGARHSQPPGAAAAALRALHPASKAHKHGTLQVSPLHTLAYEVHGNPKGQPVLCVHGGPGAGAYANHARFFDARHWRVVLVDQRGCGASTPRGCLEDNTTQALVADFEALRRELKIDTWVLFGGSWGTALSLAYAQTHTDRVKGLILRAICLMSPAEIDWMYRGGVAALQPKAWDDFLTSLPEAERDDPLTAYHKRLVSLNTATRNAALGGGLWATEVAGGWSRYASVNAAQASAWLQFDMAAGKLPSQQLQAWDGTAWKATDIGGALAHRLPPLTRTATAGNGSSGGSAGAAGTSAGSGSNGSSGKKAASPPWVPQPGFGVGAGASLAAKPAGQAQTASGSGAQAAAAAPAAPAARQGGTGEAASTADAGTTTASAPTGDAGMSAFTAQAMLEAHYCVNGAFSLRETPILQDVEKLRGIPTIGVQGRMDLVCPPVTAYKLHKAWPELRLRLVGGAGHSQYDPAIAHELLEATDVMRDRSWALPEPEMQVAVY